jgi:hypothetical protein
MGCTNSYEHYGFRIYSLIPDAPLHLAGLRELEDFIVPEKANNNMSLKKYIERHNDDIEFNVYNLRSRTFRKVILDIKNRPGLGAIVNFEDYLTAKSNLLHVQKVKFNTPAEKIGLVSDDDYIIAVRDRYDEIHSLNCVSNDPLSIFNETLEPESVLYVYNRFHGLKELKFEYKSLGCEAVYGPDHEFPDYKPRSSRRTSGYIEYSNLTNEH